MIALGSDELLFAKPLKKRPVLNPQPIVELLQTLIPNYILTDDIACKELNRLRYCLFEGILIIQIHHNFPSGAANQRKEI